MAVIFASIPVVETGSGALTRIDIVCGLRIISGSVDRTNMKWGNEPIGQPYSMPWSYPDDALGDLGGLTTIVLTMTALLPPGGTASLGLATTVAAAPTTALEDIETALHALVANAALSVNTTGLITRRVRLIRLTGEAAFETGPIIVEIMGRSPGELATGLPDPFVPDVVLGSGLALLDYAADEPRPRTVSLVTAPLPAGTSPWLRVRGLTKFADLGIGEIIGVSAASLPAILPVPWHVNTTKPTGDPSDGPVSSHLGVSRFDQILTAGDLNLDDSDIPTGFILVHDLHFTFRDGFLEIEADLAWTTPLAPTVKLGAFGALRGEVRLTPTRFQGEPFGPTTLSNAFEVEVELEWDDDPGSDLEDFHPVDPAFEAIVSGVIRDVVETEIDAQIADQVEPRVIGTIRDEFDGHRPGFFSDDDWELFREQVIAKFFIRFLSAEFFGRREVDSVTVVGGLELEALAGSYSDHLELLDLGDACPGIQIGGGFAGFTGFRALSRFRSVVRSDARCSGWHDRYVKHRKELVSLSTSQPARAARIVRTAFAVTPILASPKARLDARAVKGTLEVIDEISKAASARLKKDLAAFRDLVAKAEGATLEDLIRLAAQAVPPTAKTEPEMDESDAPRIGPGRRTPPRRTPPGRKKRKPEPDAPKE